MARIRSPFQPLGRKGGLERRAPSHAGAARRGGELRHRGPYPRVVPNAASVPLSLPRARVSLAIAVITCVVLAGLALPATAGARPYSVYGLGLNGGGCRGWYGEVSPPGLLAHRAPSCTEWNTWANSGNNFPYRAGATASMFAVPGTIIAGFALNASVTMHNDPRTGDGGFVWRMGWCPTPNVSCQGWPVNGSTQGSYRYRFGTTGNAASLNAQHVFFQIVCEDRTGCTHASNPHSPVFSRQSLSEVVFDDFTDPEPPSLEGVSEGWNSGPRTLSYTAGDVGGGVDRVALSIDGQNLEPALQPCDRAVNDGYTSPQPCQRVVSGAFAFNSGDAKLRDGSHSLEVTSYDAGGNSATKTQRFKVDNNPPEAVDNLAVDQGGDWRRTNDFDLTWKNRPHGEGAPIAAVRYKIGPAPTSPTDGQRVVGDGIARLTNLTVPADGEHLVHVWTEDAAGNTDHREARTVRLLLDTTPPAVAFRSAEDPASPAEIRATARDSASGLASGVIELRRAGAVSWEALDTRIESDQLVATFPDDRLRRGSYEVRARATDRAGNEGLSQQREDGRAMVVEAPLRGDVRLRAGFGRALRRSATVRYRRPGVLRGSLLTSAGSPLGAQALTLEARRLGASAYRVARYLTTDGQGRFSVRLPPGTSRDLRVVYAGSQTLRPAVSVARFNVRALATLRLSPRRLRRGQVLTFRGSVRAGRGELPRGGKLVQIQYLDGRHWRPAVKLGRTDRAGRFRIRYRFRRIRRPTRIRFRILVPAEGGWPYATGFSPVRYADVYPP